MYCENCGKKLIRGYQFCMECGTPVPPEADDEDQGQEQDAQQSETQQESEMPGIQPLGSDEGTLVYCPTCGMRMQKSTDHCEKCGMRLAGNSPTNSGVPLVNSDPLGGDFSGISDNDIAQINSFVNNSGFSGGIEYNNNFNNDGIGYNDPGIGGGFGGGNLSSEIEALNQQFANLNSTASDMPAISAPVRQPDPEPAPAPAVPEPEPFSRRVDNFSMEAGMPETQFLSESGLPVINGGEMSEPEVPVELEHHLDDINIDVPAPAPEMPVYNEPVPETPVYSEPVPETPVYNEPVPETPVYSEPVPETPVYSEPVAETPVYNEPIPETPVYNEPAPEVPVYNEPVAETPVYSEPVAETPVYSEPVAEAPVYSEPVPETPVYSEPVAETPVYSKPVTEAPVYSEPVPETPVYSEPVPETPVYNEPVTETPVYSEPAPEMPIYNQPADNIPTSEDDMSTVLLPQHNEPAPDYDRTVRLHRDPNDNPASEDSAPASGNEDGGVDLGKLVYCRNCGQDMYENEPVCKNCGSPNKWNQKPLKHSVSGAKNTQPKSEPKKVFGVIPIPAVIGGGVVVAGIIALIALTSNPGKNDDNIVQPSTTTASTPESTAAPEDNSEPDMSESAVDSTTTDPIDEPVVTEPTVSQPVVTDPVEVSDPDESSQTDGNSNPGMPDHAEATTPTSVTSHTTSTTQSSASRPGTPAASSATTKPVTTRPTTVTTRPTTAAPAVSKPSTTVSNEDKQRAKMLDAFEAISAEVGKVHVYAQATISALDNGKTRTFYTSGMTSTLSSGKSNAASLLKGAKPSSGELTSAYSSLEKLYDLYVEYYNYVTTSTDGSDTFSTKETNKWSAFNTAVKNTFNYSKLQTKNQTDADKSRTYADIMTDASSAASNAVTQFSSVQTAVEKLKSSNYDDEVMATIYNTKTSAILKAAGYAQMVNNYYSVLSSGVPNSYSSAKAALSNASSDIDELLGVFTLAGYNDLSGFKKDASASIKTVNGDISAINKAL